MSDPVDLWDIATDMGDADTTIDLVCQMRVTVDDESAITLGWQGRRFHFCGLSCVSRFAASPDTYVPR